MPRDFESLYKAQAQARTATVKNETVSLPPGYLVGYDVRLRQDYTVVITAGAANIGGRLVQITEDHQLADADWVAPKINSSRHYYIYLSAAGQWFVDIVAPVWNNQYLYYEQPDTNWRAVGKIFLADGQIIFAIKEVEKNEQTVTVAPAEFTGKADYYCTGENDQILINAAIRYLHEAYDGGKVNLLQGSFLINGNVYIPYDDIFLSGSGGSKIVNSGSDNTVYIHGTASDIRINCRVSDITFDMSQDVSSDIDHIVSIYANKVEISGNVFLRSYNGTIAIAFCNGYSIKTNSIYNFGDGSASGGYGIYVEGGSGGQITGNTIDNEGTTATGAIFGIDIFGDKAIVSNNTISNMVTGSLVYGIRDRALYSIVEGNTISTIESTGNNNSYGIYFTASYLLISKNHVYLVTSNDPIKGWGITSFGGSANNCSIAGNYVYDCDRGINPAGSYHNISSNYCASNGSDSGIANTNNHNFYDLGTDTQVYSNSWQQPVAGEPTQGELKWCPQATNTTTYALFLGTTTAVWSSISLGTLVPVGTKSAYATIYIQASSAAAGIYNHRVAFSSDTTSTPAAGTPQVDVGIGERAAGAGELITGWYPMFVPVDSSRKTYYYAFLRTNASNCQMGFNLKGYTV